MVVFVYVIIKNWHQCVLNCCFDYFGKHELRQSILKLATFCVDPFGQVITGESGGGTSIVVDKTTDFDDVEQQQQKSFNSGSDFIFYFYFYSRFQQ